MLRRLALCLRPCSSPADLTKTYGTRVLLGGASFAIEERERVGLVGANGVGKSSLARLVAGIETVDGGEIAVRRDALVQYLPQEPALDPNVAVRALVRGDMDEWQADRMIGLLGLSPKTDALCGTLSGGEKRRVALARILISAPALVILDEPTNHLDTETIEWLETYLKDTFQGAVLLITHDRYVLDRVVDRTLELSGGKLYSYDGGYGAYLEAKAERSAQQDREERNRQNLLRRELEWMRRTPSARTGKQKARIDRAETVLAQKGPEIARRASFTHDSVRTGKTILEVRDLAVTIGDRTLVSSLDLTLRKGERVGIVGSNGAGKTTLLRTLLGERPPSRGTVQLGQNVEYAYLDQTRSGLNDTDTVLDAISGGAPKVTIGGQTMDARAWLERFLFPREAARQPVGALSGGERARVLLARMLLRPSNLIVLDEPTNDLDIDTLSALEDMLVEAEATALVVTHDRWFLDRVATGVLAFEGDGEVIKYEGDYSMYRALRAEAEEARKEERAPAIEQKKPTAPAPAKKKSGLTYAERLELEKLPAEIDAAEARIAELEKTLADPSLYAQRGSEVPNFVAQLEKARAAVADKLARWAELEEKGLEPKKEA